ncbi:MAG: hypothetical protein JW795_01655 [Chitinivibrionales bacterium]|nr:hypothetical protein [Chitinivibrionales bacterium]
MNHCRCTTLFIVIVGLFVLSLHAEETHLSGTLSSKTLDVAGNPYIVDDEVTIPVGNTLVLKAGVVMLFKSFTGINVYGSLLIEGSPDGQVVLTSINDKKFNPAAAQLANPFDWNGVYISDKANTVKLRNFKLMYSVFGIKSHKDDLTIQSGYFHQNGQFHFTINDDIIFVPDNFSFTFSKEAKSSNHPVTSDAPRPIDEPPPAKTTARPPVNSEKKNEGKLVVAYTLLGVGIVSGIVSGVTGIRVIQKADRLNSINAHLRDPDITDEERESYLKQYDAEKKAYNQNILICTGTGLVFAAASTISLVMLVSNPKSTMVQKVSFSTDPTGTGFGIAYSDSF